MQFFHSPAAWDSELRMYEALRATKPRLIPQLHEHFRNSESGPAPQVATGSGRVLPALAVMDRGESLRDFVTNNWNTPADLAWLHSLHALCVLVRHLSVRAPPKAVCCCSTTGASFCSASSTLCVCTHGRQVVSHACACHIARG